MVKKYAYFTNISVDVSAPVESGVQRSGMLYV